MTTHEIRAALHKGLRETRPAKGAFLFRRPVDWPVLYACALGALEHGIGNMRKGALLWLDIPSEIRGACIIVNDDHSRLAGVRILARWLRERERRGE